LAKDLCPITIFHYLDPESLCFGMANFSGSQESSVSQSLRTNVVRSGAAHRSFSLSKPEIKFISAAWHSRGIGNCISSKTETNRCSLMAKFPSADPQPPQRKATRDRGGFSIYKTDSSSFNWVKQLFLCFAML
jgi:hypothetical protein